MEWFKMHQFEGAGMQQLQDQIQHLKLKTNELL